MENIQTYLTKVSFCALIRIFVVQENAEEGRHEPVLSLGL